MEKIKQNTNCRRWASLWLVMAMAVMTAIFLRGGVVVQAEENENSIQNIKLYVNDVEQEDTDVYNTREGEQYKLRVEPESSYEGATYTYQWYKRGSLLQDETSSEITVTKTEDRVEGYYVSITNDRGGTSGSEFVLYQKSDFNLSILSYINEEYYDNESGRWTYLVDRGKKAKLYVDVKISTGTEITYTWQKYDDDRKMYVSTGNISDTYETDSIEFKESYRCIIHYKGGEETRDFTVGVKGQDEENKNFFVSKYIKINGKKKNNPYWINVKGGDDVILGVTVSDLPYGIEQKDISYAWYRVTAGESKPKCISTTNECEISNISKTGEYYCQVVDNKENESKEEFTVNVTNFTGSILFDGKKQNNDDLYVDSLKDLVGKKLTADVSYPGVSDSNFSYRWHEIDVEDEIVLSTDKEYVLSEEMLSGRCLELGCEVTNLQNNESDEFQLGIYEKDDTDRGITYINEEKDRIAQFPEGKSVVLKVAFPENVAEDMKYQWYKEDGSVNCTDSEYTIVMPNKEISYTCRVSDKNGNVCSYSFELYPSTKFMLRRYVNGYKINGNGWSVSPSSKVVMEVRAMTGDSDNVTYQWYKQQDSLYRKEAIKGATDATYTIIADEGTDDRELYYCLATRGNEREWIDFYIDTTDDVCDHTDIEVLPAVPATCEKDGLTEGKRCTECGETIVEQEVVKATGHKWDNGTVTKPATATETGVKTFTCTVCKKTKTEVIQKLTTNNTVNNDTTKKPETIETSLKTGTKVTDKKSKAVYKVTGNNIVQYTKASGKKVRKAKKVAIPAAVTVNGVKYQVTAIAPNAFKNNKNLKTIIIPATVRSIGKQAFAGCKNLKSIIIRTPYLTKKSVGAKAFKGISSKAVIKVPKKQLKAYKKLLKTKGVAKNVKIK